MTTPRFHPFTRVFFCVLGILAIRVLLYKVLELGNFLSTVFTELPPTESFEAMIERLSILIVLLTYPAALLWLGFCRHKWDRASFLSLGLRPISVGKNLLFGALSGFLAVATLWAILWLTGAIEVFGYSPGAFELGALSVLPLAGYFAAFCAVACFEELLFRGYILHNLNHWLGWRFAVFGQAALFAFVHLFNVDLSVANERAAALWAIPSLFLIAVFFAQSYRKTGGLWFAIAFHAFWNFALGPLFSLPVSGLSTFRLLDVEIANESVLSGGKWGPEASIYLPILLLGLIWAWSGARTHPQTQLDLALLNRRDEEAAPIPSPAEEEPEEDARENRFKTKFGTQTGFDSQMLRELRELQRAREEEAKQSAKTAVETPLILEIPLTTSQTEETPHQKTVISEEKMTDSQENLASSQRENITGENKTITAEFEVPISQVKAAKPQEKLVNDLKEPIPVEEKPLVSEEKPLEQAPKTSETTKKKAAPRW